MENTWIKGLFGATRIHEGKHQFKHHNQEIISFNSNDELEEYLQEYFKHQCELSNE